MPDGIFLQDTENKPVSAMCLKMFKSHTKPYDRKHNNNNIYIGQNC